MNRLSLYVLDRLTLLLLAGFVAGLTVAAMGDGAGARMARAASGQYGRVDSGVAGVYVCDAQAAAFRTVTSVALNDAVAIATLTSSTTGEFLCGKATLGAKQTITVWAHFSSSSGTCQVALLYIDRDANGLLLGVPGPSVVVTLTAGPITDAAGFYCSPGYAFDSSAASGARLVLIAAPAAGTVTFWAGSS